MHEICSADSQQIITKIVASRCQILKLKGTKFEFGWGLHPRPYRRATALPQALAKFNGPTTKGTGRGVKGKGEATGRRG